MSNDKFYKGATIVALITMIFTSYSYHKANNILLSLFCKMTLYSAQVSFMNPEF